MRADGNRRIQQRCCRSRGPQIESPHAIAVKRPTRWPLEGRRNVQRCLLASAALAGLALVPVGLRSQDRASGQAPTKNYLASPVVAAGPAPRLPDGHPDLSGIWDGCWKTGPGGCYGGGTNNDMEQDLEMN